MPNYQSQGQGCMRIFSIHKLRVPVIKSNTKVTNLVKTTTFIILWDQVKNRIIEDLYCVMGHSRMVTSGSSYNINNNQPIIKMIYYSYIMEL